MIADLRHRACPALTVYSRSGCSLCDVMVVQLEALRAKGVLQFTLVDIQDRPELEARYGEWVPVLMANDAEICHYHLDGAALETWLLRHDVTRHNKH